MIAKTEAESRRRNTIKDEAAELPKHVRHLRSVYPQWVKTASITELLGVAKQSALLALHGAKHRVEHRTVNNRGDFEWRYKPTYTEGPNFNPLDWQT